MSIVALFVAFVATGALRVEILISKAQKAKLLHPPLSQPELCLWPKKALDGLALEAASISFKSLKSWV